MVNSLGITYEYRVSYTDLVKSYIEFNHQNEIVLFTAIDIMNTYNFLHDSIISKFNSEEDMKREGENNKSNTGDNVVIGYSNGKFYEFDI